eukprot:jgi/Orpsp1_1/1183266/evm.model.c7180000084501.2
MKILYLFNLLILAGSILADCSEEEPKYEKCASSASKFDKFKSKEEVESYCNSFDIDDCIEFLEIVTTKSECISDVLKLPLIASYQLPYLAYCGSKKDKSDCGITKYIKEHFSEFDNLDISNIPDELKSAVTEDCKDETCNARMLTLYENLNISLIKLAAPAVFGQTFKFYQSLGTMYQEKKCDAVDLIGKTVDSNTEKSDSSTENKSDDKDSNANTFSINIFTFISMILLSVALLF